MGQGWSQGHGSKPLENTCLSMCWMALVEHNKTYQGRLMQRQLSFDFALPQTNNICDLHLILDTDDPMICCHTGAHSPPTGQGWELQLQVKSNQIKSLLLSHHHSTSALVSEILMSVLQTVQKNNRQFTYGQTVQKNNKQFTYGQTVQKTALEHLQCSRQCKKKNNNSNLHIDRQCKKNNNSNLHIDRQCKKNNNSNLHMDRQCKKNYSNLHMDRQCKKKLQQFTYGQTVQKKTTAIYIWTVHIYRLYRRQCAKYTYMHSVRLVYYRDILNYQRHIIHRMGTSTLCTVSIHNVVYT